MLEVLGNAELLFITLIGALVSILTWIGSRQLSRIDELEREAVRKKDFDEYKVAREKHDERLDEKLDTINASIVGVHNLIHTMTRSQRR